MNIVVEQGMRRSARYFRDEVWPVFASRMGGGRLVPVETVTDSMFAILLDTTASVDAWQVMEGRGLRALATRVQFGGHCWRSWTVRREVASGNPTEWDKLINADRTLMRPAYHVQAYTTEDEGELLGIGCIRTDHLAAMLLGGIHGSPKLNPLDGNIFVPVWWEDAIGGGFDAWKWVPDVH